MNEYCFAADVGMPEYCQFKGGPECKAKECRDFNTWMYPPQDERGLIEVPDA